MEDILVPLGFFTLVFGFPLVRRELIHRHTIERLRLQHRPPEAVETAPQPLPDDAAALALRLPEPHRLYALALLCRLQDAQGASVDARGSFLIRQARFEYLPATLGSYLNVTPAAHAQLRAQGHDPELLLREQLELISRGVEDALRRDHQAAQNVLTQGAFLREVFEPPAPLQREKVQV